jgi:hypothetical protein
MSKQLMRQAPKMTTHQRNAHMLVWYNGPGLLEYGCCLNEEDRAFTRHEARRIDAVKLPLKESQAQAVADKEAIEEEKKALEKRTRQQEERLTKEAEMIEDFTPILNLDEFCSLPVSKLTKYILRQQLVWHRVVDGDAMLPAGLFTSLNKAKLKEEMLSKLGGKSG